MLPTLIASSVLIAGVPAALDTLHIRALAAVPRFDGRVEAGEYRDPPMLLPASGGTVRLLIGHAAGWVYLAAVLPDSTFYWGDDIVFSLDADGSGGADPGPGDRQWYLRRILDSSFVTTSPGGRWPTLGIDRPLLGKARRGQDWEVASAPCEGGWQVELRIRDARFRGRHRSPRFAVRTFNDAPMGWWSWPAPREGTRPQDVERSPELWIPVVLERPRSPAPSSPPTH